jgi:hypothetical protein
MGANFSASNIVPGTDVGDRGNGGRERVGSDSSPTDSRNTKKCATQGSIQTCFISTMMTAPMM